MAGRTLGVTCALAVGAAIAAGVAAADKPIREPAEAVSFDFPAGMVCPFPVVGEPVEDRQTVTTFASGKVLYTGFFSARLTNADTGTGLTFNASGPVTVVPEGDNIVVSSGGPVLFFFFPGDAGPGDDSVGRTYLIRGHAEVLIDPETFTFLSFSYRGNATDICALLA
jgi:hypothetical protein